ncbi:precorrin-6A/cobalt-precorrin-6A reductase [Aquimarina sp. RZ0]|uniref:precorrin-6A/cobalt-precorrin-6A reductase n=1 Tax=Aquimarina sp. RZ0 TaxID=2607730 RepID=UPI0011F38792|nr:precorrin-6A/cobalt-precorrin-6A reductase [Aquimarina sp. RZ0]KAA1243738.1 precorrin-6A/cobalt-precorrin-6A reductase [Aquimarina sp. RZ0]
MILVFGGTTEGKLVADILDELAVQYFYSTKTKVDFTGKGIPIFGAMTPVVLTAFCNKHTITHIINASHPFAVQLHQMITAVSPEIPLIRFQREFLPRISHQLVSYVNSVEEALENFHKNRYQSLLALSGVQTIIKLQSFWKKHPSWFRILDRDSSRTIAATANFPTTHLLFGYPQSVDKERILFAKIGPEVIFTKESGVNGKLDEKIQAALAVHIPIVILKKPEISNRYLCITTKDELIDIIKRK